MRPSPKPNATGQGAVYSPARLTDRNEVRSVCRPSVVGAVVCQLSPVCVLLLPPSTTD